MKKLRWNKEKNEILKKKRNISFEVVADFISKGNIIDDIVHPNKTKFQNQKIFIVDVNNYIYLIPYIETKDEIFLKTIYPSRKFTQLYLYGDSDEEK
ncbi:MAG: toxin [Ignavibacteria bacterium GWB2_35_12]|nr:MAG: toxin [Ignavibacteria bacterium GWB2_35_12]OGU94932.1 MAG: toxin [Ignavibacteria bacterium RIFOXYA2_FULL_35_10]OGV19570.1 MAG: toxin [Ignavibacteria bacterium RIFOXYC2_FULL_35_21]